MIVTIGIAGAGQGTGATHFAVMLANYLCSKERRKVAIAEMNGHQDFIEIHKVSQGTEEVRAMEKQFVMYDVVYYRNISSEELTEIINNNYEYLIIDFGCWDTSNLTEFLRCSKKILTGSLCEWKRIKYLLTLEQTREVRKKGQWEYLTLFGNERDIKQVGKAFEIKLKNIPFEPDAFLIQSKNFKFFKEFI